MSAFGMRMTKCICGHPAIEHYDSHDICTWACGDDAECSCERFQAVEMERWVQVGEFDLSDVPSEGEKDG